MSPTYHLSPGAQQTLPEASIEVLLSTSAAGVIARESLIVPEGSGARVVPVGDNRWIVQWDRAGAAALSVRAAGHQPFPAGTAIQASFRLLVPQQTQPRDVVEVTLDGVDGLTEAPLLTISRSEGGPLIFVRPGASAVPDVDSEVGRAALAAARQVVDQSHHEAVQRHPLVIAVDASASMQPLWDAGAVTEVVDFLHGLASVIGTEEPPRLALVRDEVQWIDSDDPGAALAAAHADAGVCLVTVSDHPEIQRSAHPRTIVFVVTDEIPWPLAPRELDTTTHFVLIGAQPQITASVRAKVLDQGIHVTTVDPRRLLREDKALVHEILSPYLPEV